MTRQSNFFQRVIAGIEKQLAREGVRVTESALRDEATSGTQRETDVLIEGELNGYPVTIAVECRDETRPQDVMWIDALIGKYRDSRVEKIVAVSTSGFTAPAEAKAKALGIATVHFAPTAGGTDFPIDRLNLVLVKHGSRLARVEFTLDPPLTNPSLSWEQALALPIAKRDGSERRTFRDDLTQLFHGPVQETIREALWTRRDEIEDLAKGSAVTLEMRIPFDLEDGYVHASGKVYRLKQVHLFVIISAETIHGALKSYSYNHRNVLVGTANLGAPGTLAISAVQVKDAGPFALAHAEVSSTSSLAFRGHRKHET